MTNKGRRSAVVHVRTLRRVAANGDTGSRQEGKRRTRAALLSGALCLLADRSLAGLSLREVTREAGIVPTAFYRHFASMDELGVSLVDESMRSLRHMIREARRTLAPLAQDVIAGSVATLVAGLRTTESHVRFLVKERYGGVPEVRRAIAVELKLFAGELATDLGRFPGLASWSSDDLRMAADLMVAAMLNIVMVLLEVPRNDPAAEREVVRAAERQLRLIVLGMAQWRSG